MDIITLILLSGTAAPGDLSEYDRIICADSGYRSLEGSGAVPDLLIGDMDSIGEEYLERARSDNVKIAAYDPDKDWTDGELAVRKSLEVGSDRIIIVGGLDVRLDHIMPSFHLLHLIPSDVTGELRMGSGRILLLREGESVKVEGGGIVSVLPSSDICVITEKGFRWNLNSYKISKGSTRGIHNEIVDETALIVVEKGSAYVIVTREGLDDHHREIRSTR